jgi:two-component system, OmpR family, response regulator RegX3
VTHLAIEPDGELRERPDRPPPAALAPPAGIRCDPPDFVPDAPVDETIVPMAAAARESTRRVLLIEDESSISEPLAAGLSREGFETSVASTAGDGLAQFAVGEFDLVLLDVMLPDGDGRDVLREIRRTSHLPVVFLTSRGEGIDKVVGLELGADDYVTKPFLLAELVARMRAVLRRGARDAASGADERRVLRLRDVELMVDSRTVTRAGRQIDLTLKEFELLRILMEHAGQVVRRGTLMDEVWDPHWYGSDKTLDVHMSALRRKLGDDPTDPQLIFTVRGVGFRAAEPDDQDNDD